MQIIARVKADPDQLPRLSVSFGYQNEILAEVDIRLFLSTLSFSLSLPLPHLPPPGLLSTLPSPLLLHPLLFLSSFLPQNFGLDTAGFRKMISDCPLPFYHLATECCKMNPDERWVWVYY